MMKKILLGTVAVLLAAPAAFAADAVYAPPEAPAAPVEAARPAFSWDGGYIGALGGYGWGDSTFGTTGLATSDNFDGGRLGGFAGWNFGFGNGMLAGVEGDLNYDWNENNYSTGSVETGLNGSVRARLGYEVMDRGLLYAAGGWTATDFKVDTPVGSDNRTLNGWTIGAGFDYAVTDKIFTRIEYRYNDFGERNIFGVDSDFKQNVVNVGVGVKF